MSEKLPVSDHALIRYMERIMGLDLENLRSEISNVNVSAYKQLGDGNYPIHNVKARAVIKDGIIVTVYE